jgi:hypothetical protein
VDIPYLIASMPGNHPGKMWIGQNPIHYTQLLGPG